MARILVIDDEQMMRETLNAMLQSGGHRVVEAVNGRDGLAKMRAEPADLVITDIIMPEMEGVEALLTLLDEFPGLKVIAISGGGRTGTHDFLGVAAKLGAARTLQKPFSRAALLEAVESCLS